MKQSKYVNGVLLIVLLLCATLIGFIAGEHRLNEFGNMICSRECENPNASFSGFELEWDGTKGYGCYDCIIPENYKEKP